MAPFTLYDATIVAAKTALQTLDNILTTAEQLPDADRLLQARLHPDMSPLSFQVYAAARFAGKLHARLTGLPETEFADDLASFADMHARIAAVQETLGRADRDAVDRLGEESAPTALPSAGTVDIAGKVFAMGAAVPNLMFHVVTAYGILRKEGVVLGKWDYIRAFAEENKLMG